MSDPSASGGVLSRQQHFEQVLSLEPYRGLKAILSSLSRPQDLCTAVDAADSYETLLARLGYRLQLTKQIHVQDAYSHVGPGGGIRAVLSYNDIATHSGFPTLVNYDSTLTTTPRAAEFFNRSLLALKKQLPRL